MPRQGTPDQADAAASGLAGRTWRAQDGLMRLSRRLGLVLGVTQVLSWATTFYLPAVCTRPVADAFGASPAAVLGAFSWSLLVSGLCVPRAGRLIERHGGRPVLAVGALLQAAGLLVLSASNGLPLWYAGWTLAGLGMAAGLYDAAFATAGRILGDAARPVITGITLIGGFASTVGWPVGAFMLAHLGWRSTLVAYAGVLLLVNLPLFLLLIPPAEARVARAGVRAGGREPTPGFAPFACFVVLRALVGVTISVYAPGLLAETGLGPADAVLIASLIGPAQVGCRLLDAAFGRWMTPLAGAWISAVLLPLAVVPLVAGTSPYWAGMGFVLLYGGSNGLLTIVRGTLPLFLWGAEGYAARVAQLGMPFMLAQAAAPTLVAPLVSALPAAQVFAAMGLVGALAALCLLPLRRPQGPQHRPAPPP